LRTTHGLQGLFISPTLSATGVQAYLPKIQIDAAIIWGICQLILWRFWNIIVFVTKISIPLCGLSILKE